MRHDVPFCESPALLTPSQNTGSCPRFSHGQSNLAKFRSNSAAQIIRHLHNNSGQKGITCAKPGEAPAEPPVCIRRKITAPMGGSPAWTKSFPTGWFLGGWMHTGGSAGPSPSRRSHIGTASTGAAVGTRTRPTASRRTAIGTRPTTGTTTTVFVSPADPSGCGSTGRNRPFSRPAERLRTV